MSTKEAPKTGGLQDDLNREVDEGNESDEAMDLVARPEETMDEAGQLSSTEVTQKQSTNPDTKKHRSRPSAAKLNDPPKRRRTNDSETTNDDAEPVPSSATTAAMGIGQDESSIKEIEEQDLEMDSDEEENENLPQSSAAMFQSREETDRVLTNLPDDSSFPSTSRHNTTRPENFEELFRLPIFESDSLQRDPNETAHRETLEGNAADDLNRGGGQAQLSAEPEKMADSNVTTENQRISWARRILFMSTELIFPGFQNATSPVNRKPYFAVRVRSSWVLQALLYAEALFFTMWVLSFLSTADISMSVLKELHGNLVLCMSALFILVNIPRLMFGFRGNEHDKMELIALFWMMTFIVQAPLFGFILFTDIFTPIRMAFTITMDSVMMAFIILEFVVGTLHLKNLIRDELRVIELAKRTEYFSSRREENIPPRISRIDLTPLNRVQQRQEDLEHNQDRNDGGDSDDDWSTDESVDEFSRKNLREGDELGYRMKIRRYASQEEEPDEPENDDANLVTSTSDSIRHRPIRVT